MSIQQHVTKTAWYSKLGSKLTGIGRKRNWQWLEDFGFWIARGRFKDYGVDPIRGLPYRFWSTLFFLLTGLLLNPLIEFRREHRDFMTDGGKARFDGVQARLEWARRWLYYRTQATITPALEKQNRERYAEEWGYD